MVRAHMHEIRTPYILKGRGKWRACVTRGGCSTANRKARPQISRPIGNSNVSEGW